MRSEEEKKEIEPGVPEKYTQLRERFVEAREAFGGTPALPREEFDVALGELHVEQAREAQRHLIRTIQDLLTALHLAAGLARTQQFASPVSGDLWNRFGSIADGTVRVISEGEELLRVVRPEAPDGE